MPDSNLQPPTFKSDLHYYHHITKLSAALQGEEAKEVSVLPTQKHKQQNNFPGYCTLEFLNYIFFSLKCVICSLLHSENS